MSEGRRTPNQPNRKNISWLHSDPGVRTLEWLRNHPTATFQSVLETAKSEIESRVRRALTYSSDSSSENGESVNVINKREFTFAEIDASLLPATGSETQDTVAQVDNAAHPSLSESTASNVTGRREFSLTSYDSSRFDPEDIYRAMSTYRTPNPAKPSDSAVETEIEKMRRELEATTIEPRPGTSKDTAPRADNAILNTILEEYHEMRANMTTMSAELKALKAREHEFTSHLSFTRPSDRPDVRYSRYDRDDVQDSLMEPRPNITSDGRQRIREAREYIPTFDGSNEDRLKEFLKACEYAYTIIQPAEETALTRAIICTRLKGGALTEVENRGATTYSQLRDVLESCYSRKKSTTRLQREFNNIRQRHGEEARAYGNRAEKLTLEFFESVTDGTSYTISQRQTIQDLIKSMALTNFELGLNEKLQTIVRSRAPATLADAIAFAIEEERVKGFVGNPRTFSQDANAQRRPNNFREDSRRLQCYKCGKPGHIGRECRSSRQLNRHNLPKPDGGHRINTTDKFCVYCKKSGHIREECWKLVGRPGNPPRNNEDKIETDTQRTGNLPKTNYPRTQKPPRENDDTERRDAPRPASTKKAHEFYINQVDEPHHAYTGLDLVQLPIEETKTGKAYLLFDTGSSLSFIKLRNLEENTLIKEERIVLAGITGHQTHTLGKFNATIKLGKEQVQHDIYVVRDDLPIHYEGILGVDFLQSTNATCNYSTRQLNIQGASLKLYSHRLLSLQPRCVTIITATTNKNKIGMITAEEIRPGIFIGNCVVEPIDNCCKISVINTTEETVEIGTPYVEINELDTVA